MNSFGRIFRISIFGESHGESLGILIDGCPAGIQIQIEDLAVDLERRKKKSIGTTTRIESDIPVISSGVMNGYSTGAPILIQFKNEDIKSNDYSQFSDIPRPSHSDFAAKIKYKGFNDIRGGGHFSGRLTLGIVAAGVIAKKLLSQIEIHSEILSIGGEKDFLEILENAAKTGDSLGGIIECKVDNLPIVLGEPFFDSVESVISHLIFSIPGIKGIEFGSGFQSAMMLGSNHNDEIINENGETRTNHSGGIVGGLTNGNQLVFRVAVKPTPSISKIQNTINLKTDEIEKLQIKGRHDTCFALRLPPVIEAAAAIALTDLMMINRTIY